MRLIKCLQVPALPLQGYFSACNLMLNKEILDGLVESELSIVVMILPILHANFAKMIDLNFFIQALIQKQMLCEYPIILGIRGFARI